MALDLLDTNSFPKSAFSLTTTERSGFTFDPDYNKVDFDSWKREFEKTLDLSKELTVPQAISDVSGNVSAVGRVLYGMKEKADEERKEGYTLKTIAAVGDFFSKALTASMQWKNANRRAANTQKSVENQMLAIDNQVQYYKNLIADKFNKTMATNAVVMAAKGLRVTAGNLLEQTKDAAYDATKDIATLESNARLKKIALQSEERQANVARHLTKQLLASDLIGSAAKLGLTVNYANKAGVFEDLFKEKQLLTDTVDRG